MVIWCAKSVKINSQSVEGVIDSIHNEIIFKLPLKIDKHLSSKYNINHIHYKLAVRATSGSIGIRQLYFISTGLL